MARYGLYQLAGAVPAILVSRLDQLWLSVSVDPQALGHYAAATSLTSLALPVISAIGSVIFPRIALQRVNDAQGAKATRRAAIGATTAFSTATAFLVAATAHWIVPLLFGQAYLPAVRLVWVLAPGVAFMGCSQVCSDILRGYGIPLEIAKAQWVAAISAMILLIVLIPSFGASGAAVATVTAAAIGLIAVMLAIRRLDVRESA